jgi:hypothetical protein
MWNTGFVFAEVAGFCSEDATSVRLDFDFMIKLSVGCAQRGNVYRRYKKIVSACNTLLNRFFSPLQACDWQSNPINLSS